MKLRPSLRTAICSDNPYVREAERFILLPPEGLWQSEQQRIPFANELFSSLAAGVDKEAPIGISPTYELRWDVDEVSDRGLILPLATISPPEMEIARGAHQGIGPTLVELDADALLILRQSPYLVRVVPEQRVSLATSLPAQTPNPAPTGTVAVTVEVTDRQGSAIRNAEIEAFSDFQFAVGDVGSTDAMGRTTLLLGPPGSMIERLYVRADRAVYWGHYATNVTVPPNRHHVIRLDEVDPSIPDCVRHRYSPSLRDGSGVRIGVIDTGIDGAHPDLALAIAGGRNTVLGEPIGDHGDNGTTGHGTHLAGIIAANPGPTGRPIGLAPSSRIFSYRVYGQGQTTADSFSVLEAAIRGVSDDACHLLNMSLAVPGPNAMWNALDSYVWERGSLAFAAAGNTNRGIATLPATLPHVAAVGAIGRKHTYPSGSLEEADELGQFGLDSDDYTAAFSPESLDVQLVAPGVGVMSTLPGGLCGPWSGTSQASAAAVGRAAALLSGSPLLALPADSSRAAHLWSEVFIRLQRLGMGLNLEGGGVLQ